MIIRNLPNGCMFVLERAKDVLYLLASDIDKDDKRLAYQIGFKSYQREDTWKLFASPKKIKMNGDDACLIMRMSITEEK